MLCFLFVQITTKCNIVQIVQVLDLALAKISESDKKTIIWNFMEELWENYLNALENNLPTKFNFMDFLILEF
jgi:hypothetical protein